MLLHDRLKNRRIILASHSPRRREILTGAGLEYVLADNYEVEECYPATLAPEEVAPYLARLKSDAYPLPLHPDEILLTADTVVIAHGQVLGKPQDPEDARRMLRILAGTTHTVVTGVCIRSAEKSDCFPVRSEVTFGALSEEEIAWYVDRFHPMDKAGSYGIQEWIGYIGIERIEGSFYNVMGLPVQALYRKLETFIDKP